jgi:glucose-1-phosphate adenylyltransferase
VLTRALDEDAERPHSQHDFGKNIIPALIHSAPVFSDRFYDENKKSSKYWRDIGTLDAYFDASMDLCQVNPEFNLYDPEWPLRTYQPQAPPTKFVFAEESMRCGQALDSVISNGCIVSGSGVVSSILCPNVRVHSFGHIESAILMPGVRVGRHARLRKVIVHATWSSPAARSSATTRRAISAGTRSLTGAWSCRGRDALGPIHENALRAEMNADRG